ncbi:beta-agarase, partial [Candidatus Bathyarchaeota archaeon]
EVFTDDVALLDEVLGTGFDSFDRLLDYTGKLPDHLLIAEARSRFLSRYAERYFSVCHDAVKRADPNHMILGCRFAVAPPREVLETVKDYVDVVSINNYSLTAPTGILRHVYEVTGKPMMVTEFSFKAMDSGLPNTKGAGIPLKTQRERAEHCKRYIDTLLTLPFILGYHWFQYMDQPKEGRFDGENSNFGLVKIDDEPYRLLVETFKQINFNAEKTHLSKT